MNIPLLYYYYVIHQGSTELDNLLYSIPSKTELSKYKLLVMKDSNVGDVKAVFDSILAGTSNIALLAMNDEYTLPGVADRARDFLNSFLPEPSMTFESSSPSGDIVLTIRNATTCVIDNSILPPVDIQPKKVDAKVQYRPAAASSPYYYEFIFKGMGFGIGCVVTTLLIYNRYSNGKALYHKN